MRLLSPAAFVMALLAGCASSIPGPTQRHVNANGLQLSVSQTYKVTTTPTGFGLEPAVGNRNLRSPMTVSIQLLPTPPKATGYRFRYLGSWRMLWYTVTQHERGGSSGAQWTVVAYEHVGHRWIEYQEEKLSEWEPYELWEIAQGLRYEATGTTSAARTTSPAAHPR